MRTHTRLVVVLFCTPWLLLLVRLDSVPPGFQHDQTFDSLNALEVVGGHFPIYFPANFGLDPLFMYAAAGIFRMLGGHYVWGIRFTSAIFAMLGLAFTLIFARRYLGRGGALLATALTAGSFWFLFAGRLGLEPIALLPPALACFYFLARTELRPSFSDYLLAGVMAGVANYTYLAARTLYALPLILLGYEAVRVLLARLRGRARPPQARIRIAGPLVMLASMLLVSGPLLAYLLTHSAQADGRIGELSGPINAALGEGNLLPLVDNFVDLARTLLWDGSPWLPYHYALPGRAVLQPIWAAFFVVGLAITLARLGRRREFLLLVALSLGLGLTLLTSTDAIHMRSIYALPLLFIVAVRGAAAVVAFGQRQLRRLCLGRDVDHRVAPAIERTVSSSRLRAFACRVAPAIQRTATAVVLVGLLSWQVADTAVAYFRDWATAERTQRIYNADFRLAARYLDRNAGQDEIFIGTDRQIGLDSQTYALYEPLRGDVNWYRLPGNPPLPERGGAIYLGPTTADIPPVLRLLLAAGAQQEMLRDSQGRALMWLVRAAPDVFQRAQAGAGLQSLALPVNYESALRLDAIGWQDRGDQATLTTQWTALGLWPRSADPGTPLLQPKMGLSITDRSGYRWLYTDVSLMLPVHNVRAGLPMLETTPVALPPDMPPGSYELYLVLYDDKAGPLTLAQGSGPLRLTPIPLATVEVALRPLAGAPVPPYGDGETVGGTPLHAAGWWESWERLIAGVATDLHISWQAQRQLDTAGLTFRASAYDENLNLLWQQIATPETALPPLWEAGRTLRLSHAVKPPEGAPGATTVRLAVCAEQAGITVGCATADGVQVISQPPTMALSQPPEHSIAARWGDSLTLVGYDLDWGDGVPALTLYWKAGMAPGVSLKRFVHLLGADGRIVAQSDELLDNNGIPVMYWRSGEYVVDHPRFGSPQVAGVQTVCVGLYDAVTEERLTVVMASGEEAPDGRVCFR